MTHENDDDLAREVAGVRADWLAAKATARRLVWPVLPRIRLRGWSSAEEEAEHEGWSISFQWLGFMVEIGAGRIDRLFE